jgi:diguanylate cyclase (GGDEF)-like protein/PAS domain S-box-containing protein
MGIWSKRPGKRGRAQTKRRAAKGGDAGLRKAEEALRRSEERFRGLAELSSDWYWEQDEQFRFIELGEQKRNKDSRPKNYTGRTRWEVNPLSLTPEQWAAHRAQLEAQVSFHDLEFERPGADGRMYWVSVSGRPIFDEAGRFRGYRGIGRDITAQKHAEDSLRESEARFRSLTQMSSDFFWETDEQSRFTQLVHGPSYVAQFANVIIGKTAWDLPSTTPDEAGWARLRATIEAREPIRDFEFGRTGSDGAVRYFSVSGEPRHAADGSFLGYRGVGRDITEVVLSREHIASLAYSDVLTGLANRTSLVPALEQAVERARRRSTHLATMFIDLDGFKQMNDAYGHASGDRFLIETAQRLRSSVRASDMVARLGGDEFFVVLEDVPDAILVETVARKLLAEIMRPFELVPGDEMRVSASVGIAVFPDDAADAATLMKHADMAMYKAKQAGKNDFRFFAETSPDYDRGKITSS